MLKGCIKLVFICITSSSWGQFDPHFFEHLHSQGLKKELHHYLTITSTTTDSTAFYWMRYHYDFGYKSSFIQEANCARSILRQDSTSLLKYSVALLNTETTLTKLWFESILDSSMLMNERIRTIHNTYYLAQNPIPYAQVPDVLQKDYANLLRAAGKKPAVSGLLSAVVPGAGMLYLNKPKSFLSSFVFVGAACVQTIESIRLFGYKHPLTIINGGFFLGFYLVNVVGSILEVRKNVNEFRNQFLIHASGYYSDTYHL